MSPAFIRFVLVGAAGFVADVGITQCLIWQGVPPQLARIPALAAAMTLTWLANRRFTFKVAAKRTLSEGLRYVAVGLSMAALNFLLYFVMVRQGVWPLAAIVAATAQQTCVSFFAYRLFAFRQPIRRSVDLPEERNP